MKKRTEEKDARHLTVTSTISLEPSEESGGDQAAMYAKCKTIPMEDGAWIMKDGKCRGDVCDRSQQERQSRGERSERVERKGREAARGNVKAKKRDVPWGGFATRQHPTRRPKAERAAGQRKRRRRRRGSERNGRERRKGDVEGGRESVCI